MTRDHRRSTQFASLDAFGRELLRVARSDSRARRRSALKRVAVALGVVLVVVPAGFALALPGEEPSQSRSVSPAEPLVGSGRPEAETVRKALADIDGRGCVVGGRDLVPTCWPVIPGRGAVALGSTAGSPPDWLIVDCRTGRAGAPSSAPDCEEIIAIAEGRRGAP
jgi:hypothetical protein